MTYNFLTYNNLSSDDRSLFFEAGLNLYLDKIRRKLINENSYEIIGIEEPLIPKKSKRLKIKEKAFRYNLKNLSHSEKELSVINTYIEYILNLIGKSTNSRFGITALEQHNFFNRIYEGETFLIHLFMAIQKHKRNYVIRANPDKEQEILHPYTDNGHQILKSLEKKNGTYFKINNFEIKETSLYAAGVYYMINFLFDSIKSNNTVVTSRLSAHISHFISGPSYLSAYGKAGAEETAKIKQDDRELAYEIFCNQSLYKWKKVESILNKLKPFLRRYKIKITDSTLRTKWIPEFIQRYKDNQLKNNNNSYQMAGLQQP